MVWKGTHAGGMIGTREGARCGYIWWRMVDNDGMREEGR